MDQGKVVFEPIADMELICVRLKEAIDPSGPIVGAEHIAAALASLNSREIAAVKFSDEIGAALVEQMEQAYINLSARLELIEDAISRMAFWAKEGERDDSVNALDDRSLCLSVVASLLGRHGLAHN